MRALNPFSVHDGALIGAYSARLAEALAVRRAALEARAARAQAELSIKARSEFLANMNHELRTPLNAIIGFATMLRDSETYELGEDQRRTYAEYVLQSADLLLAHINTILETAALDSGSLELLRKDDNLRVVLEEAVARAQIAAAAAEVLVENRTTADEISFWGDAERVGQAVDHLLRVALRASAKGASVLVRAAVTEAGLPEIAIRDTGEALTPEAIREALSAFDKVHRGLDRAFAGPGVGLVIAKTFIELQGGRFEIKSRAGKGTVVRIALPGPRTAADIASKEGARLAG
ncbi:MAG: HAMP domain-containing sensor histidine kinase [Parvularculaceae bacterium]